MKYFIILFLFIQCTLYAQDKFPKFVLNEKRVCNVGTILQGDTVKHCFVIKNEGNAPLIIYNIGKSCNCTNANIEKKVIPQGASTKLSVVVATNKKIGFTVIDIFIKTNSKENEHVLKIIMTVVKKNKNKKT